MGRRTLLLIASILVAALGTALIWLYVQGADSRAQAGEVQVPVVVSANPVPAGSSASTVKAEVKRYPQSLVRAYPGVITDPTQIQGYARTDVVPGVPLVVGQFATTAPVPQPAVQFDPTKLAMQVTLPDPQRLAGILQPGDQIRIFVAESGAGAGVLLDRVKVLSAGPAMVASSSTTTAKAQVPQAIVTLEVDNGQALTLVRTQSQGSGGRSLWFGLLGAKTPGVPILGAGG